MLKFLDIIMSGIIMYNKTFKFLSKKMEREEIIDLLKSVYEHSKWVPERLLNENISEIQTKEELQLMMKKIVDDSSETEKLNLINAHPELGKKLQKKEKLTKFSEDEQKSAGLDQCSDEEFKILTKSRSCRGGGECKIFSSFLLFGTFTYCYKRILKADYKKLIL